MRLASVSATPYIPIANSAAAATNQSDAGAVDVEVDAAQRSATAISTTTCSAVIAERDDQVAEHEQRPRDRRGEQLAPGAALAVDDHAEAGEHRVQRDQQADGADRDEAS